MSPDVPKPAVFDKYDIETSRRATAACCAAARWWRGTTIQMLDEFLKACDKSRMVSRYVTRDEER